MLWVGVCVLFASSAGFGRCHYLSIAAKVWHLPSFALLYRWFSLSNPSFTNVFTKFLFAGSLEISLSTGRDVDGGKAVYIWISPDPAKAGPTLGVVVVIVVYFVFVLLS